MTSPSSSLADLASEVEDAEPREVFHIDTSTFEGPLHLLLDLARRQKVDLLKISILTLAEQYLEFVEDARSKRIDLAADYLLMAAWLAFLKSKLLLPKPDRAEDSGLEPEDMAQRLAFRLRRLDAMRTAARELTEGPVLGERVFLRGAPERPKIVKTVEYDTSLWHLTQAFGAIRGRQRRAAPHRIEKQFVLPLESARQGLKSLSARLTEWSSLGALEAEIRAGDPDVPPRSVTASVFSAALELARDGDIDLKQDDHFTPLYVRTPDRTAQGAGL
ncbi:MAG: ScpA family protein [Pseudomonadota bacterium]